MIAQVARVSAPVSAKAQAKASMRVWNPFNNKFFETMSFLPPLSDAEVAAQVEYLTNSGFTPCIEFASAENSFVSNENCTRFTAASVTYQDNRYWTMFKLPMFGCTNAQEVLREINNCKKLFPGSYIRVVGFDNVRQVQCAGFLVQRPDSALPVDKRSVA
jgi:ribulose-bisphosphate carboxylase small chain